MISPGEALGDGLEATEGGRAGSGGDEVEGVVDAAEGGHVDNNSGSSDTGGVLTGSGVYDIYIYIYAINRKQTYLKTISSASLSKLRHDAMNCSSSSSKPESLKLLLF